MFFFWYPLNDDPIEVHKGRVKKQWFVIKYL